MKMRHLSLFAMLVAGCAGTQPRASSRDTAAAKLDPAMQLVEARVPPAVAGDPKWQYAQRVSADLDGDGTKETAVLIADALVDAQGQPMWDHGHRWQVYVEAPDGQVTRVYARFLPNGKLTAELVAPDSATTPRTPRIVLLEQSPYAIGVYEVQYLGPGRLSVQKHLDRAIDTWFTGSPRP